MCNDDAFVKFSVASVAVTRHFDFSSIYGNFSHTKNILSVWFKLL